MAANLRPDAFAGTAAAYLRFRPPYPRALLDDLLREVPGRDMLIDLACGPGRIALDLAGAFTAVHANDLEPEMIATGKAEAARRGIGNVRWSIGRAEDRAFAGASIDLVTIGEAFAVESFGRPESRLEISTVPGASSNATFDVRTTATTGGRRLRLNESA